MKPPSLPGAEKFRFCDKKFNITTKQCLSNSVDRSIDSTDFDSEINAPLLITLSHSLSTDTIHTAIFDDKNQFESIGVAKSIGELTNGTSSIRFSRNKRKPILPISSKMTSRVFTLTSDFRNSEQNSSNYFLNSSTCDIQSLTSLNMDTSSDDKSCVKLLDTGLYPNNLCLCTTSCSPRNLINSSTSRTSLLSDFSLPSINGPHNESDDQVRSSSCSPVDHWAKNPIHRLSTFSQSSWDNVSGICEIQEIT